DCARDRTLRLREIRLNLRIREHLIVSDTLYGRVALFCVQVSRERAKLPHRARKIRGVDSGIAVRPLHVAPFARLLLFYQGSGHRIVITCNSGTKRFSLGLLPANLSGHDRVPVLVIDKRGPDILHRLPPKPTQLVVIVDSPVIRGSFENPFNSCYRDDHSNPPEKMRGLQPTQTLGRGRIQERADLRLGERSPAADIQSDKGLWSGRNGPWERFKKPLYRLGILFQYADVCCPRLHTPSKGTHVILPNTERTVINVEVPADLVCKPLSLVTPREVADDLVRNHLCRNHDQPFFSFARKTVVT